jgi:hypothetical protein
MRGYISPLQFGKLFAITTSLAVFGHAPILNQVCARAGCAAGRVSIMMCDCTHVRARCRVSEHV